MLGGPWESQPGEEERGGSGPGGRQDKSAEEKVRLQRVYCGRRYVKKWCGPHPLMLQEGGVGGEASLRPGDAGRPTPWTPYPHQGSLNV